MAITVVIFPAMVSSSTTVSKKGMKLRSKMVLEPIPAELAAEEPESREWIKTGDVAKLWPGKSDLPVFTQYIFASTWIFMIASLPFYLPMVDGKPVTITQKIVGGAMLCVLFGGLYLFTNIILFKSGHFEEVRSLTIIECIYFMSQIITTVGYGDITPAQTRGQVFVAMYVVGALFVISMLVSQLIDHCTTVLSQKRERLWGATPRLDGKYHKASMHDLLEPPRPSMKSFLISLAGFAIIQICWTIFFSNFPGENKTLFVAFYMSLITLTTVGFGAITPLTEGGMIFAAFFMIIGSAAIVNAIGKFCKFIYRMIDFQRFGSEVKLEALEELKQFVKASDEVTELEFFQFVVMRQYSVSELEIKGIGKIFESLKHEEGSCSVKLDMIKTASEIQRSRSFYYDDGKL
jgi:voltage-gated potassium channel Kch